MARPRREPAAGTGPAPDAPSRARIGLALLVSVALLCVFGGLFASADAAFAHLLATSIPTIDPGRIASVFQVALVAVGAAFLAARRPTYDDRPPVRPRLVKRVEWALPLATLNALFLAFVLVQVTVLFGGHDLVLRTADLTYAQYARGGFWQLLVVTGLTLAVLGVALRLAPRSDRADRVLLRVLLGGLGTLTLVIVASALRRMSLYEQAYGYTRLRVYVTVVEVFLGLLFVLVLVALAVMRTAWLPRVVVAAVVVALLGVGIANPDGSIARGNVDRFHHTGRIDASYLATLSADAVPALDTLEPGPRDCVLKLWLNSEPSAPEDWRTWNYARTRARALLTARPPFPLTGDCP